ncbi:hypothetical protein ACFQ1M_08070 [Sungkyunkwania multivorans]|uniref:Uncharacterized protein n=1 Tax=Sungkyunkwania multivorans TaxID=1173618 RepID=A0ABW3CYM0_9FLAO
MSKTIDFLNSLDHRELAYFYKYKSKSYTKPTQEVIENYLFQKRGMNIEYLERLLTEKKKKDDTHSCPRCGSSKLRRDRVEVLNNSSSKGSQIAGLDQYSSGRVIYDSNVICNVCGFWISDVNDQGPRQKSSILERIFDFFIRL